jgi:hypothetical protein
MYLFMIHITSNLYHILIHIKLFRFDGPIEDAGGGRRRDLGFRHRKPNPNPAGRVIVEEADPRILEG